MPVAFVRSRALPARTRTSRKGRVQAVGTCAIGIVPGQDRIGWRGTLTGPTAVDANWVRVREG